MQKFDLGDLKIFLKKISIFLKKWVFWISPCFFIILLVYAGFLLYHYALNPPKPAEKISAENTKLKTELYQKIIKRLDQREKILQNELQKTYRDIFK